jgi:propionyl-CoA carboxylase alpha chain
MFEKILIANRGEIAIRIIRTCKRLGVKAVAVYSEIDARSLHVREADEAFYLGPSPSTQSYLVHDRLLEAARTHGCQAVHPGYGFLSENSRFAEAVEKAGLVFIGPPAGVIATLGDKIAAKNVATRAGVPVVPGHNHPVAGLDEIRTLVEQIGYPVLLKPAAGGGGRGMRIVRAPEELAPALSAAQDETRKAFGDDRIFLERFVTRPRHIEVQIIADRHGRVLWLGERECSVQRRYQKVIEEAPSVAVDEALRRRLGELACSLAREAGYVNAGTVEFIMDQDGSCYFMEMNTRLQVEHPVTEMVTGLDLVELQLKVAAGEPLPLDQDEVKINGWSIEARICAEDPHRGFLPSTGLITHYAPPRGTTMRLDSGVEAGSFVSVFYDSLLSKVIARGATREDARIALVQALNRYHILGVTTNVDFTNAILNHPSFIQGDLNTHFIEEHFEDGVPKVAPPEDRLESMAIAATMVYHNRRNLMRESLKPISSKVGVSHRQGEWHRYMVKGEKTIFDIRLTGDLGVSLWEFRVNGHEYKVIAPEFEFYRRRLKLRINGQTQYFRLEYRENFIWAAFCGINRIFEIYNPREWELAGHMPSEKKAVRNNILLSPLPGMVVSILARKGDRVYHGQDLVIIESMKLQSGVSSPCDGTIEEVRTEPGKTVSTNEILMTFKVDDGNAGG